MTTVPPTDVSAMRRRLIIMAVVNVACAIVAVGSMIGQIGWHIHWLVWTFGAALVGGFGTQIWAIVGFVRQARAQ